MTLRDRRQSPASGFVAQVKPSRRGRQTDSTLLGADTRNAHEGSNVRSCGNALQVIAERYLSVVFLRPAVDLSAKNLQPIA